ncbi:ArsI/CadI family heavy metal resistance metalloenzyme [Streptomyces sp. KL110A]|uniref:ArsI/CadI family heavy metal resistance metalloenzyme n=1 Tax=Streptomyces sp. KL110A TaxID=3384221 RepID=UPI0038C20615
MSRVQLALRVPDLAASVAFCTKLFGTEPAELRDGYADFSLAEPPLKLVLVEGAENEDTRLDHLGVEIDTTEAVHAATARLGEAGLPTEENDTTCCYALQDEVWVHGPRCEPWEVNAVKADADTLPKQQGSTCCAGPAPLGPGGAGQTLGRTLCAPLARHTGTTARTTTLTALGALTTAAFAVTPGPYSLVIAVSIAAGMVRGNLTLLQATAVTDRRGTQHYGRLSALLSAPAMTASALAPFAAATLASILGGYPELFGVLAGLAAASEIVATATSVRERK